MFLKISSRFKGTLNLEGNSYKNQTLFRFLYEFPRFFIKTLSLGTQSPQDLKAFTKKSKQNQFFKLKKLILRSQQILIF